MVRIRRNNLGTELRILTLILIIVMLLIPCICIKV